MSELLAQFLSAKSQRINCEEASATFPIIAAEEPTCRDLAAVRVSFSLKAHSSNPTDQAALTRLRAVCYSG